MSVINEEEWSSLGIDFRRSGESIYIYDTYQQVKARLLGYVLGGMFYNNTFRDKVSTRDNYAIQEMLIQHVFGEIKDSVEFYPTGIPNWF